MVGLERLLDGGAIRRAGRGRPRLRSRVLLADRAYSSHVARRACRARRVRLETPPKRDHVVRRGYDRELYKRRNVVERLVNRLKRSRRLATRFEKRACYFGAFVTLAFIMEWL